MALTIDSTVKELRNNPQAVEICKKYGLDLTDKRISIVSGWSARKLAGLSGTGMDEEKAKALEEELKAKLEAAAEAEKQKQEQIETEKVLSVANAWQKAENATSAV